MRLFWKIRGALGIAVAILFLALFAVPITMLLVLGRGAAARRLIGPWARVMLACMGTRIEVVGGLPRTSEGFVVAANHTSLLDTFIYPALLGERALFVGKSELRGVPLFGWLFARLGNIFVRRGGGREASEELIAQARQRGRGLSVFLHPEGTRSRDGGLQPFKKGFVYLAIGTGKQVLPVVSFGGERLWPRGTRVPRPGTVRVAIGEPLSTAGWRPEEAEGHCAEVQAACARLRETGLRR